MVLIGGMVAGALWAGIAGVLKATVGAHEVVTTIMLNYVAQWLLRYLIIGGPLQLADGTSTLLSRSGRVRGCRRILPNDNSLDHLRPAGRASTACTRACLIALVAVAVFAFLLWRTSLGYEIRAVGQSQKAARYAGVSVRRTIIVTMLIAGAFAGLAGAIQIAGVDHNLTDKYFSDTTGFDAIAVALLGLGSAVGIVLASLLFGALHAGGAVMQSDAGISSNLVLVLQALILFSIAANFLGAIRLRHPGLGRRPSTPAAPAAGGALMTEAAAPPPEDAEHMSALSDILPPAAHGQPLAGHPRRGRASAAAGARRRHLGAQRRGQHRDGRHDADRRLLRRRRRPRVAQPVAGDRSSAIIAGGLMALIHAVVSIRFRADQIVSGIAINIFAAGLTVFLVNRIYGLQDIGHVGQAELLPNIEHPAASTRSRSSARSSSSRTSSSTWR